MKDKYFLKIAGIYCRLVIQDKALLNYLKNEYFILQHEQPYVYSIKISRINKEFHFISKSIQFKLSLSSHPDYKIVDFIIMTFLAYHLAKYNILFLHASSIINCERGLVYFGNTGAGKSTIINKIPKNKIYSNDTAIIKKIKDKFYLYSSPFDKLYVNAREKKPIRLSKIIILYKSKYNNEININFNTKLFYLINTDIYGFIKYNLISSKNEARNRAINVLFMKLVSGVAIKKLYFNKEYDPAVNVTPSERS